MGWYGFVSRRHSTEVYLGHNLSTRVVGSDESRDVGYLGPSVTSPPGVGPDPFGFVRERSRTFGRWILDVGGRWSVGVGYPGGTHGMYVRGPEFLSG